MFVDDSRPYFAGDFLDSVILFVGVVDIACVLKIVYLTCCKISLKLCKYEISLLIKK